MQTSLIFVIVKITDRVNPNISFDSSCTRSYSGESERKKSEADHRIICRFFTRIWSLFARKTANRGTNAAIFQLFLNLYGAFWKGFSNLRSLGIEWENRFCVVKFRVYFWVFVNSYCWLMDHFDAVEWKRIQTPMWSALIDTAMHSVDNR